MTLTDADPMPYGKHAGVPMADVPADYLLWVADNMGQHPTGTLQRLVRAYVDANREALETEVAVWDVPDVGDGPEYP